MRRDISPKLMVLILGCVAFATQPTAAEEKKSKEELEKQFIELMDHAVLEGFFTIDGVPEGKSPPKDRYKIVSVKKQGGSTWIITSSIEYMKVDVQIPVPVEVKWAGDTPMIILNDVSLPGMTGKFSTRLLLDGHRYAGTWSHDKHGGHMWGKISKETGDSKSPVKAGEKPESRKSL